MPKIKNFKGFTLLEILVATGILVMVGVAAIGVEKNFMGSAGVNKHKLQATALAQEGLSFSRKIFNDGILNPPGSFPTTAGTYYIDASNNLVICPVYSGVSCNKSDPAGLNKWNIPQNGVTFTRTITIP